MRKPILCTAVLAVAAGLSAVPAEAAAVCPHGFPATAAVLTSPNTSVSCSFIVIRSATFVVTLTMQSINTASARAAINGMTCVSVSGISGASANLCNVTPGTHTFTLSMSISAAAAEATLTPVNIP